MFYITDYKRILKHFFRLIANIYSKRSYPRHLIDFEMKEVKYKTRKGDEKIKSKGVPFGLTFHLSLNSLHKIIRNFLA